MSNLLNQEMELYHGSTEIIQAPIILEQQRFLDFGKGFYLTSSKEQAIRWAHLRFEMAFKAVL